MEAAVSVRRNRPVGTGRLTPRQTDRPWTTDQGRGTGVLRVRIDNGRPTHVCRVGRRAPSAGRGPDRLRQLLCNEDFRRLRRAPGQRLRLSEYPGRFRHSLAWPGRLTGPPRAALPSRRGGRARPAAAGPLRHHSHQSHSTDHPSGLARLHHQRPPEDPHVQRRSPDPLRSHTIGCGMGSASE